MTERRAEFIAVGSELLEPWRLDTNGSYVALRLGEAGIPIRFRTVVGDILEDLQEAFRVALARSDLIVATGGLGPTVDDLTREALAGVLGVRLVEDPRIARSIEERFRRHGREMPPRNRLQALVPEGAEVLPNRLGTAPGLLVRREGAVLAVLPGVPAEMRAMVDEALLPRLEPTEERFVYRVFKIAGLTESEVDRRLAEAHRGAAGVSWTILAAPGQIEIHLRERVKDGEPPVAIERIDREIEVVLGRHLFARDAATMEEVVGGLLLRSSATLGIAESLTGGWIARRVTAVPGASRYFRGGVVCYSDESKMKVASVRAETLRTHGAVSAETAVEMARGIRGLLGTTWGLAATGFAGPEGGGEGIPIGTVFFGLSGPGVERSERSILPGERETVRERAARVALDRLRLALLGERP